MLSLGNAVHNTVEYVKDTTQKAMHGDAGRYLHSSGPPVQSTPVSAAQFDRAVNTAVENSKLMPPLIDNYSDEFTTEVTTPQVPLKAEQYDHAVERRFQKAPLSDEAATETVKLENKSRS